MTVYRLQAAVWMDTTFPADAMIINPHFDDHGIASDPEGLAQDLAEALATYYTGGGTKQITVKAYDAEGTPPVYPAGEHTVSPGVSPVSAINRDVAVCLSYYAERNIPRQRGRLYIPCAAAGIAPSAARPNSAHRQKVADLVPILTGLGGLDVDWVVWSKTAQQARPVTNWWVDDTWDTQRRRGLRATTRLEGTVSE